MKCLYCPGTDILGVYVDKAYRRGGTVYYQPDGKDTWDLDEFHTETSLAGITHAGDINLKVCLDCNRIQGFEFTPEQKQSLIDEHMKKGYNCAKVAREKKARQEAARKERESRQHLYEQWKADYCLFVFYDKDDEKSIANIARLSSSIENIKAKLSLIKLEWSSTAAFKPKIRYHINDTYQCCLTDKRGGDIVRLNLPESAVQLVKSLDSLGYRKEARDILPQSEFYLGDNTQ